jgi:Tol biopolymer transport system component/DNA-directed RNA polymerase specialized sigma24 family protein
MSNLPVISEESGLEAEVALWLETAAPDDPGVWRALVGRYTGSMLRLALAVLAEREIAPHEDIAWKSVRNAFQAARVGLAGFRGQESVRGWLLGLTLQAVRRRQRFRRLALASRNHKDGGQADANPPAQEKVHPLWHALDGLPQEQRLAVILSYALRLSLSEIANILSQPTQDVHRKLCAARRALLQPQAGTESPDGRPHPEMGEPVEAALDGLLARDPAAQRQLENHLQGCAACRLSAGRLEELEANLIRELDGRWSVPEHSSEELETLVDSLARPSRAGVALRRVGVETWLLGGVLALVLGVSLYLATQDTHRGKPVFSAAPEPTPVALQAPPLQERRVPGRNVAVQGGLFSVQYIEPAFSADGRWLAFVYLFGRMVAGQPRYGQEVWLFDRQGAYATRLSLPGEVNGVFGSSRLPSISADGRFVAFVSDMPRRLDEGGQDCQAGDGNLDCFELFLYDRMSGKTRQMDPAPGGAPADSGILLPAISPDGGWVAFWSTARNLAGGVEIACRDSHKGKCWNVYLHNLESGETRLVPVGRTVNRYQVPDGLSLTLDARRLALTIDEDDLISEKLRVANDSQIFLYDPLQQSFEAVSVAVDGAQANGASLHPRITPDGRFVAFVSLADNLVTGDSNQAADVFVRDLQNKLTQRVSIAADGSQGDNHSGDFFENMEEWDGNLDISADGRFVAFVSTADNLSEGDDFHCQTMGWFPCSMVYIYDRFKRESRTAIARPELNALYPSLALSADGAWLGYVHVDLECPRNPICAVMVVRDQQGGRVAITLDSESPAQQATAQAWELADVLGTEAGRIASLAFSPDGLLLAAGDDDGGVNVWRVDTGEDVIRLLAHRLPVSQVAFSPDGSLLASASRDGRVKLYATQGWELQHELASEGGAVLSLGFSPDGEMLAAGAEDASWNWDLQDGAFTVLDYFEYPGAHVERLAFSPDGTLLAHALSDGSIWLRKTADGETVARLAGHEGRVLSLAFSPDGHYLASGGADGRANVWQFEAQPGKQPRFTHLLLLQYSDWVTGLTFRPNRDLLAVAALGTGLNYWKLPGGELQEPSLISNRWNEAYRLAFSPDGRLLAASSPWGGIKLWRQAAP